MFGSDALSNAEAFEIVRKARSYGRTSGRAKGQSVMSESRTGTITLVIPWLITIVGAAIGLWQFILQQQQANRQPFLQRQLELCFQASEITGRLSSETDPAQWEKDRVAFWKLYWGPLSIVEDQAVESAMVEFGKLIPSHPQPDLKLPMTSLGGPSYKLAHAIRGLVASSWQVNLPSLEGLRTNLNWDR